MPKKTRIEKTRINEAPVDPSILDKKEETVKPLYPPIIDELLNTIPKVALTHRQRKKEFIKSLLRFKTCSFVRYCIPLINK